MMNKVYQIQWKFIEDIDLGYRKMRLPCETFDNYEDAILFYNDLLYYSKEDIYDVKRDFFFEDDDGCVVENSYLDFWPKDI